MLLHAMIFNAYCKYMSRVKKDGKYVNIYMKAYLAKALDAYSESTGISKTACLEKALEAYLKANDKNFKVIKK